MMSTKEEKWWSCLKSCLQKKEEEIHGLSSSEHVESLRTRFPFGSARCSSCLSFLQSREEPMKEDCLMRMKLYCGKNTRLVVYCVVLTTTAGMRNLFLSVRESSPSYSWYACHLFASLTFSRCLRCFLRRIIIIIFFFRMMIVTNQ